MEFSNVLYKLLEKVSIGQPNVIGSASDQQILYVADYDMLEKVVLNPTTLAKFKNIVKSLASQITDIKIGAIEKWNLLTSKRYSQKKELKHLDKLWNDQIVTQEEYNHMRSLLKSRLNKVEFLRAQKEGRFGLLRWTPQEVALGQKVLRDNNEIRLEDACRTNSITKIDAVLWFRNKYVEVSNNIMWAPSVNKPPYAKLESYKVSVQNSLRLYLDDGNYMKAAKRLLLLSRHLNLDSDTQKLLDIFNGPVGRLYMIMSNLETLKNFPDQVSAKNKKYELDFLIDYYNHLYFKQFHGKPDLDNIPKMEEILQENVNLLMRKSKLLPVKRKYFV